MQRPRPDEDTVREQFQEERDRVEDASGAETAPESVADAMDAAASEAEASRAAAERDEAAIPEEAPVGEDQAEKGEEGEGPLDPLAKAEQERDRYLELAQRAQADFENYRKRAAKEAASAGERAKIGLLRDFLPVLDNLERALESVGDGDASLAEGVRLVHSELVNVLKRNGVEPIEAEGKPFDPTVHEAMSTMAQDGTESGTVLHVVEKGYRLNETVIRPARVVVSA